MRPDPNRPKHANVEHTDRQTERDTNAGSSMMCHQLMGIHKQKENWRVLCHES